MAGIKISALPAVGAPLLTDIFPEVQAGTTFKVTLQQVFTLFNSSITGFLPLSGGTMTGNLILNTNPTLPLQAATKQYVDTFASGITVILSAQAATTANLNSVYANGAAGVGATLTNAGAMVAFAVDGYSANLNDRILVKDQTTTFQNGVYSVTTVGSGAANWVLTRTTDYDQAPSEIKPGTLIAVNNGTLNATTSWLETATVTTIGVDPILFSQFTFSPSSFLLKANNLSDVASAATSRTNLGLGTAATKAASDNTKATVASVSGATTVGHFAIFADTAGTVTDGGITTGRLINIQRFLSNGTYTPTAGATTAIAKIWGAGGGSTGNGSTAGGAAGSGGTTSIGILLTATGGAAGAVNTSSTNAVGGVGSLGTLNLTGGVGAQGGYISGVGGVGVLGPYGGSSPMMGTFGTGSASITVPVAPPANTGAGAGAPGGFGTTIKAGNAGGAGGYAEFYWNPVSMQTITVGTGGSAGSAGTGGVAGQKGSDGLVVIEEYS